MSFLPKYFSRSTALLLAVLGCYWLIVIYQLGAQWSVYEQYNYGWAVPFLCLYLLWERIKNEDGRWKMEGAKVGNGSAILYLLSSIF